MRKEKMRSWKRCEVCSRCCLLPYKDFEREQAKCKEFQKIRKLSNDLTDCLVTLFEEA